MEISKFETHIISYAPAAPGRVEFGRHAGKIFLPMTLVMLALDVFISAVPAFSDASPIVNRLAHSIWTLMPLATAGQAICTVIVSLIVTPTGAKLRLARGIAVGMLIYHWWIAPGDGTYSRLLWGSC